MRILLLVFHMILAGCTADIGSSLDDPILRRLVKDPAAQTAGSQAVLVYLSMDGGETLTECRSGSCDPSQGVRLLVRAGRARSDLEEHGSATSKSGEFTFFRSVDGSVSPYGFLSLKRPGGNVAWIQRLFGDGEPVDTMSGELQLRGNYFAQFSYKGDNEQSHLMATSAVEAYASRVGLY